MFILNTTFVISPEAAESLAGWIASSYIPALSPLAASRPIFSRVLTVVDPEVESYSLQFLTPDIVAAENWLHSEGAALMKPMSGKWGESFLHFTTFLEILNDADL